MAQQMPGGNPPKIGEKRRGPEEEKKSVDPRDLMGRFRSKRDIYDYLLYYRKISISLLLMCIGQYYMPPITKLNKDFLKEVFAGRKHLIPQAQIRPVVVPKYDELSVKVLYKDVMTQPELAKYFPAAPSDKHLPDREYFFNVVNTSEPMYLQSLIRHAQNLRFANQNPDAKDERIEVNDFWAKELEAAPFFSSKFL
jgi:hypothetical protein